MMPLFRRGAFAPPSRTHRLVCFVLLLLASATAAADDPARLVKQRLLFEDAEQALDRRQPHTFHRLLGQLQDYPLYPYLVYEDLRRRLSRASDKEVNGFLTAYADTPLAPRLRRTWIKRLYEQKRWKEVVASYHSSSDAATRCRYTLALYRSGEKFKALAQTRNLWLVGHSQPTECDAVFEVWRNEGRMTPKLVWQRIRLAMQAGQPSLARYLARFLPEPEREWVDLWRKVRSYPSEVATNPRLRSPSRPVAKDIVLYGIRRWATRDPEKAAAAWAKIQPRYHFSAQEIAQVQRGIGLAMLRDDAPQAMSWLARIDDHWADSRVRQARPLSALKHGDWKSAVAWMDRLNAQEKASERWQYWRGRALEQLGEKGPATGLFARLAGERSFYGFLSADRVGTPYALNDKPLDVPSERLARVRNLPGVRRAHEFLALGRVGNARTEWYRLTQTASAKDLAAAAVIAHRWGWHDLAILALGRLGQWDDLDVRFPLAFRGPVVKRARDQSLNPAWVFAVVRQESAFTANARSPKGALGLMQLLPRTARSLARRLNARLNGTGGLLEADTNIRLGSAYLRRLLDDLDGHPALATAAYNAGPSRVKSWQPDEKEEPADLWIETIPFKETHDYLRRVFTYTAIYEQRLGKTPSRLTRRLPPIPPKSAPHRSNDSG